MWPFKKHIDTLRQTGLLQNITDWHSHILPGVDDGIKTMEDAIKVLEFYDSIGIRSIWLTPHIMEDYPNETQKLKERFEELKKNWKGDVHLNLAAENMMDTLFEERLEKGDLLPIGKSKTHLLVETSYFNPPIGMDKIIDNIFKAGYYPLLAHPERYRYMDDDDYRKLRDKGVKFQLNYVSVVGGYGETARKRAEWLLKNNMIDVVGSDVHRLSSITSMIDKSASNSNINIMLQRVAQYGNIN